MLGCIVVEAGCGGGLASGLNKWEKISTSGLTREHFKALSAPQCTRETSINKAKKSVSAKTRSSNLEIVRLCKYLGTDAITVILGLNFHRLKNLDLAMATFNIPCSFPTDPVHIFVFAEVLNAIELKSRLSSGDTDYLYAFVDAELVPPTTICLDCL